MAPTTLVDRAVLRLSGEGVRDFLQGLVTSDVTGALPVWAGLLTPQGKALFDFIVWRGGDDPSTGSGQDLLIDCEAGQADALARRLTTYRLRRAITITRDEALAVHWSPSGSTIDPRLAELGARWLAPRADGDASAAFREHRLWLGVVEGVAELGSDKTLWLECNARELGGVNFAKGCYVGQENTARMHHRAKINRRLVVRRVDRDPGDVVSAYYPGLGLAVALMRTEAIVGDDVVMPEWLKTALTA